MVGITPVSRRALAIALLVLAVIAGVGLRAAATAPKESFTHDEAISYIAATCHQGEYQEITFAGRGPYGRWVPAYEWQRLLQPEDRGCLGRIAADLARYDIHPPLYFWLLHGWALLFGVGVWTGTSLNIALAALGTLALFGLARRVLDDEVPAAAVAFVWAVSPAVVQVFAEARQYELLGLLTILVTWQALRFAGPEGGRRRDVALLAVATAAGLLTHYHFTIVLGGVAGLLLFQLGRTARPRLLAGLGAMAAGCAAFGLLHPGFWMAFATQRRQAGGFVAEQFPGRLDQVAETLSAFLLPPGAATTVLRWPVAALVVATAVWLGVTAGRAALRREPAAGAPALLMLAWTGGVTVGLYLLFVSHGLAMTPKYLAAAWPFLAFVPVLAAARLPSRGRLTVGALGCALLSALGALAAARINTEGEPPAPGAVVTRADSVVADNVARGIFPRVVWELRPTARVFAAEQRRLLADPGRWNGPVRGRTILVTDLPVSDARYGNSPERGAQLLAEGRRGHAVVPAGDGGVRGLGRVYTVR